MFGLNQSFRFLRNFTHQKSDFSKQIKKYFSHGPFNPTNYKHKLVGTKRMTTEEHYYIQKKNSEFEFLPIYNMRGVHPIRQSGPIPPYYGTYTMDDVRKCTFETRALFEATPQSTHIEELMRRVPGLTRKEAEKIQSLGLNPWEELDYAYLVVNNGIDVFYERNHSYFMSSKGEKVECLYPTVEPDEITYMGFTLNSCFESMDEVWDPVPGEPPIIPMPDYELGAPNSYFEYELDNRLHLVMSHDQQLPPEDARPCPVPRNPNCTQELWKPQTDLQEEDQMQNPNWFPTNTAYNIYNKKMFSKDKEDFLDESRKI